MDTWGAFSDELNDIAQPDIASIVDWLIRCGENPKTINEWEYILGLCIYENNLNKSVGDLLNCLVNGGVIEIDPTNTNQIVELRPSTPANFGKALQGKIIH